MVSEKNKNVLKESKKNYLSAKNMAIFWTIIIVIGLLIGGSDLALGLVVAAIISFILVYFSLNSQWEGTIEKIKTEQIHNQTTEDGSYNVRDITYAHIRLINGKIKKVHHYADWKVGDKIKKEKGEFSPKKI